MKQGVVCGLALLACCACSFASPVVSVTSACYDATCSGGVRDGSVVVKGVQSLDVWASATIGGSLPLAYGQNDSYGVDTLVTIQVGGSGAGALVVDPQVGFVYPYIAPTLEGGVSWQIDGLASSGIQCILRPFYPGCSAEQLVPITLGSTFTVDVGVGSLPLVNNIPWGATLSMDLNLWAVSADGDVLPVPVTLADDSPAPEPVGLGIVGFALVCGLLAVRQLRHLLA